MVGGGGGGGGGGDVCVWGGCMMLDMQLKSRHCFVYEIEYAAWCLIGLVVQCQLKLPVKDQTLLGSV